VEPYGLVARNGFWYVVGRDADTGAVKTFRVDRIDGEVVPGEAGAFERPTRFSLENSFERDSKLFEGGDDKVAVVRVDGRLAPGVVRELGDDAVRAHLPDGSVEVLVPCGNHVAFRNWLFAMVDRAVVVSPKDVRDAVTAELATLAQVGR
jgi:predicted DNA-binding transcriptional regulator YafY